MLTKNPRVFFTHSQIHNSPIDFHRILHIHFRGGRSDIFKSPSKLVQGFGDAECGGQGNDLELIPIIKMETRHSLEIYFNREFRSGDLLSLRSSGGLKSPELEQFSRNFCIFLEKRPLMKTFSKFCSESLHRDTDRHCCVQNS